MVTSDAVWMTSATLGRLREELAELTGRTDLDGASAARARELRDLIQRAETERKPDDGLVEPGMRIKVRFESDTTTLDFLFGDRELIRLDGSLDLDVYSPTSPLGRAIGGHYVGDTVTYEAPHGAEKVTIVEAVPFG